MRSRRTYRVISIASAVTLLALLAFDALLFRRRARYDAEIERLRLSMTTLERDRATEILSRERNKVRVAIELLRRQARAEQELHLSIALDSNVMYLERDGAVLREIPIDIGPERVVGSPPDTVRLATPRGERTIARVLGETDSTEVPAWVFVDRGVVAPEQRTIRSAFGPAAIVMQGGTLIYSMPSQGPLADSAYVMPGAVRARTEDLRAILPNLKPGLRVYFY
jgi:hypothetical protein